MDAMIANRVKKVDFYILGYGFMALSNRYGVRQKCVISS